MPLCFAAASFFLSLASKLMQTMIFLPHLNAVILEPLNWNFQLRFNGFDRVVRFDRVVSEQACKNAESLTVRREPFPRNALALSGR
jgi:hypothetical protein